MFEHQEFGFLLLALCALVVLLGALESARSASMETRLRAAWRIEAKLDLILKRGEIVFDAHKRLPPEVEAALARGERLRAMVAYRQIAGGTLNEARDFIDQHHSNASN